MPGSIFSRAQPVPGVNNGPKTQKNHGQGWWRLLDQGMQVLHHHPPRGRQKGEQNLPIIIKKRALTK